MDATTLAYLAGVIDTQGIIRVRKVQDTELPMLAIHGPNIKLLEVFAELTGTKVTVVRRDYMRAGCAEHCTEQHQHILSVSGRWSVTGIKATVLLWNVRPYLRLQADAAVEAINLGMKAPHKQATPKKMAELGWSLPSLV